MTDHDQPTLHETLAAWFEHLEAESGHDGSFVRLFALEDGRILKVTLEAKAP